MTEQGDTAAGAQPAAIDREARVRALDEGCTDYIRIRWMALSEHSKIILGLGEGLPPQIRMLWELQYWRNVALYGNPDGDGQ